MSMSKEELTAIENRQVKEASDEFRFKDIVLPEGPTPAREAKILEYVTAGKVRPIQWSWIELRSGEHVGRLAVMADVLALGDAEDFFRVNITCATQQQVADVLGLQMITAKVSDEIHRNAVVRLTPCLQNPDARMSWTHRMFRHHMCVERKRAGLPGLVSTVGKDWIITNKLLNDPKKAANYGWHDPRAPYAGKWQTIGLRHNLMHVDYSQVCRLMRPTMLVDGVEMNVGEVLENPDLCGLLSDEGPIMFTRHPGVLPLRQATIRPPQHDLNFDDLEENFETPIAKIQARNFTKAGRTKIDLIVIHTMEASEKPTTAEAVARWFASDTAPKASAHYCVDSDSIVQCVDDEDVAWHAPGANNNGIGIEHAGYAKQSGSDWSDTFSSSMLQLSSKLAARLCWLYAIPVEFVDANGLLRGERGVTTHAEVSKAFKKSNHWDPGPNFPMQNYLSSIRTRLQRVR